ncbi:diguanylate cyclase [Photobacterium sagamiensis]|uniref:GGDEF domain-containing protein n=1 Tax=Photobacterium sagamiensis TaxID=2910241 RepID=UPI003D11A928
MTTFINSSQLESSNYAYIELSEKTLQKQLALLFPFAGMICAIIAFTYLVSNVSPSFTFSAIAGMCLCYLLTIINRYKINPFLLVWVFIIATTAACTMGFYADDTRHISTTIGLAIPLLCFFALQHKHAAWYSSLFGGFYIVLSVAGISDKQLQISEALQNISAYSTIFVMAYLLARHRNEAIRRVKLTATTDFLTGLHNRQGLLPIYQNESARSQRYMRDFSMLLLDIDNFKSINDRYGLHAGDQMLMMLTKCLREHTRQEDHLARLGGKEFCVLLPETDIKQAEEIASYLKDKIANWSLILASGHEVSITVSVGITPIEYQEFSYDYIKADSTLRRAKSWGCSQIAISE